MLLLVGGGGWADDDLLARQLRDGLLCEEIAPITNPCIWKHTSPTQVRFKKAGTCSSAYMLSTGLLVPYVAQTR